MLIFFNWQGVMYKEFVPEGQTLNSEFYREVMVRLLKRLWCVRLDKAELFNWFLLYSNAPSHNTSFVKLFLTKRSVTVLYHPPYSPGLSPADYFLFFKVKSNLKGHHFDTISDIWNNVTSELKEYSGS